MTQIPLTLKNIRARPVFVPLKRPVVSRVGIFREWPNPMVGRFRNVVRDDSPARVASPGPAVVTDE